MYIRITLQFGNSKKDTTFFVSCGISVPINEEQNAVIRFTTPDEFNKVSTLASTRHLNKIFDITFHIV